MNLTDLFPNLTGENHEITSPRTVRYNCIAWAACNTERWWQPGVFWPIDSSREDHGVGNVVEAFGALGYEECDNGTQEEGFEKVALYGSAMMYTHAARQLSSGKWTSKLGQLEDITHTTPEVIEGGDYGEVVQYMKRPL
ncbi:MAG: hypothetical protein JXM70_30945 [Pirellulales bacterium]|nr:hypothetical protein [Pirellulales bacterium]